MKILYYLFFIVEAQIVYKWQKHEDLAHQMQRTLKKCILLMEETMVCDPPKSKIGKVIFEKKNSENHLYLNLI
jgi:hypothetical protein